MAFDVQKWLTEDLGYSAEEAADLGTKLSPRADRLEAGVLRQADYSRHMNDLQKGKTELQAASDKLNKELAEWAELKGQDSADADKLRTQLDQTEQTVLRLTQKVRVLADQAGANPDEILKDLGTATEPTKRAEPAASFDAGKYVDRDSLVPVVQRLLRNPAEVYAITREHESLTGQPLGEADLNALFDDVLGAAGKNQNLTLRQAWETRHHIPEARAKKDQTAREAEIKTAEQRGYEKARSEAALPGPSNPGHAAPVFTKLHGEGVSSKLQRPQPGQTTRSFAASLASGKYRQPAGKGASR